jgi:hypothetical protein
MLINLRTWSCIEIRMQDEVTIKRMKTVPLELCKISNILEERVFYKKIDSH